MGGGSSKKHILKMGGGQNKVEKICSESRDTEYLASLQQPSQYLLWRPYSMQHTDTRVFCDYRAKVRVNIFNFMLINTVIRIQSKTNKKKKS